MRCIVFPTPVYSDVEITVYELCTDEVLRYLDADLSCGPFNEVTQNEIVYRTAGDILDIGREGSLVVTVHGDSMIDASIYPGDEVIISKGSNYSDGDIVLARCDEGNTLKFFHVDREGKCWLVPANTRYDIIPFGQDDEHQYSIEGVMTKCIRSFDHNVLLMHEMIRKKEEEDNEPCVQQVALAPELPSVLKKKSAKAMLKVAQEADLLDENYQPVKGVAMWKCGGIAWKIGTEMGIKDMYVLFGSFWNKDKEQLRKKWSDEREGARGSEFSRKILRRMR